MTGGALRGDSCIEWVASSAGADWILRGTARRKKIAASRLSSCNRPARWVADAARSSSLTVKGLRSKLRRGAVACRLSEASVPSRLGAMALSPNVKGFQDDARLLTSQQLVAKYILPEQCGADIGFDQKALRARIARRFTVPLESVFIVGSAKLGFTLHDKYMNEEVPRPAYSEFSAASDIDIAIVSETLFDHIWKMCFDYWDRTGYRFGLPLWDQANDFRNYLFRGWMRPDMLPAAQAVSYSRQWFQFFQRLMSDRVAGDNRITAGLYREPYFFERYQEFSIARAQAKL